MMLLRRIVSGSIHGRSIPPAASVSWRPARFVDEEGVWQLAGAMKAHVDTFATRTRGKGTYEITERIAEVVRASGVISGIATVFIQHTSASLVIFENADRSARADLDGFFERLVPEDEDYFTHTAEGSDDTTSHLRMVLTRTSEVVPIVDGQLALGTWQGIFLFEHRRAEHQRQIVVSVVGI